MRQTVLATTTNYAMTVASANAISTSRVAAVTLIPTLMIAAYATNTAMHAVPETTTITTAILRTRFAKTTTTIIAR